MTPNARGGRAPRFKTGRTFLTLSLLTAGLRLPAFAQFSIDWHTIDGGGGTSTGGVYSVSGTIGQPDASATTMTGGPYSLTGGFWSLIAVQTPGAPKLTIVPAGSGQATISCSPDTPGFVLQETLSLSPTNTVLVVSPDKNRQLGFIAQFDQPYPRARAR